MMKDGFTNDLRWGWETMQREVHEGIRGMTGCKMALGNVLDVLKITLSSLRCGGFARDEWTRECTLG
ncbi:hypothetical protein ACET3Z_016519 [Daucus carota]